VNCLSDGFIAQHLRVVEEKKTGLSDVHDVLANGEQIRNAVVCPRVRPSSFAVELPIVNLIIASTERPYVQSISQHSTKAASSSRAFKLRAIPI
jgi:hypothetical protein